MCVCECSGGCGTLKGQGKGNVPLVFLVMFQKKMIQPISLRSIPVNESVAFFPYFSNSLRWTFFSSRDKSLSLFDCFSSYPSRSIERGFKNHSTAASFFVAVTVRDRAKWLKKWRERVYSNHGWSLCWGLHPGGLGEVLAHGDWKYIFLVWKLPLLLCVCLKCDWDDLSRYKHLQPTSKERRHMDLISWPVNRAPIVKNLLHFSCNIAIEHPSSSLCSI